MNWIDFIIGATLMNAMPHFVLGTWNRKMLSGFGTGNLRNKLWGLFNGLISIGLFLYKYGIKGFQEQTIYTGALLILLAFFLTTGIWYRHYYPQKGADDK